MKTGERGTHILNEKVTQTTSTTRPQKHVSHLRLSCIMIATGLYLSAPYWFMGR